MNDNLNLVEILKDCPKGTKLYSTLYGEVKFNGIGKGDRFPVRFVKSDSIHGSVTAQGLMLSYFDGECTLFPSREERDWSKFKVKKPKFDPRTLQAFDKVLVRMSNESYNNWYADFVAEPVYTKDETPLILGAKEANMVIPYNEGTKHLVGTAEEAPEHYRYWED